MQGQQRRGALSRAAPEAALRGHPVLRDTSGGQRCSGRTDATRSALDAVFVVHETEKQLGLRIEAEPRERAEVGVVIALDRNRQVHPVDRPRDRSAQSVGHGDEVRGVGRLDEVRFGDVAVTEMEAKLYLGRNR